MHASKSPMTDAVHNCARCEQPMKPGEYKPKGVGRERSYCRACRTFLRKDDWARNREKISEQNHRSRVRVAFGIDYDALLEKQRGVCAICGTKRGYRRTKTKFRFSVDHCHTTGRVRGLLCQPCNTAIGLLNDDPALLARAAAYLQSTTA
jgi:hypothetical protein